MMFQEDSTNDRIEETRELLYKIIKVFIKSKIIILILGISFWCSFNIP